MCGEIKQIFNNKSTCNKQLEFYKLVSSPLLLYVCETLLLNEVEKVGIEMAVIIFIRGAAFHILRDEKNISKHKITYKY